MSEFGKGIIFSSGAVFTGVLFHYVLSGQILNSDLGTGIGLVLLAVLFGRE